MTSKVPGTVHYTYTYASSGIMRMINGLFQDGIIALTTCS